jgi:hypothetical protein
MTTPALHPDAITAKCLTIKHWRECGADRPEKLGNWKVTRGDDGRLHVSARMRGPNPADALQAFMRRQTFLISYRSEGPWDDQMPQWDLTVPGRISAFWRLSGVWVEVWHPDTDTGPLTPVQADPVPSRQVPGGRLPTTRRNKETTTA